MPTTNTSGNSKPLALCMVIITTQLSLSSALSRSVYSATSSRKPDRLGSSGWLSRKAWMLEVNSCTFSSRPRLSMSFFSVSIAV